MNTLEHLDAFLASYIEAALWSTNDDAGNPLDQKYSPDDLSDECREILRAHCVVFLSQAACYIAAEAPRGLGGRWSHAGHDLWLTQAGHGCGFWDGDWVMYGDLLTNHAKRLGNRSLYVGDDGKIHEGSS